MVGGLGDNVYVFDNLADVMVELTGTVSGRDEVSTKYFSLDIAEFANIENLTLLGLNNLDIVGTAATTRLVLTGNEGDNMITGGNFDDVLFAIVGADLLYGGSATDILFADEGNDWLTGGGGTDYFTFGMQSASSALIWNFVVGTNVIDLRNIAIETVYAANAREHTSFGVGSAIFINDSFRQNVSLDFDADAVSDYIIEFGSGWQGPSSSDFLINAFSGTADPFYHF